MQLVQTLDHRKQCFAYMHTLFMNHTTADSLIVCVTARVVLNALLSGRLHFSSDSLLRALTPSNESHKRSTSAVHFPQQTSFLRKIIIVKCQNPLPLYPRGTLLCVPALSTELQPHSKTDLELGSSRLIFVSTRRRRQPCQLTTNQIAICAPSSSSTTWQGVVPVPKSASVWWLRAEAVIVLPHDGGWLRSNLASHVLHAQYVLPHSLNDFSFKYSWILILPT